MNALAVVLTPWGVLMSLVVAAAYGMAVSAFAGRHARAELIVRQESGALAGADELAGQLMTDATALDVWHSVIESSAPSLANLRVRLTAAGEHALPAVARRSLGPDRPATDSSLVVIPRGGAVLRFNDPRLGVELLLRPADGFGSVEAPREMLLAFADQIESFARAGLLAGL